MKTAIAAAAVAVVALVGAGSVLADTHSPHAAPYTVSCTDGRSFTAVSPADASHVAQAIDSNTNLVALAVSVTQNGVEVDHFGQTTVRNPNAIRCTANLGGGTALVLTAVLSGSGRE